MIFTKQKIIEDMTEASPKQIQQLETTKHTQENSIIEEKVTNSGNGESVRRYVKGRLLGKGGFARCYEVTNIETKKVSAIKIIDKANLRKSKAKQKLITEIKIHKTLKHKNIITFDHVFEDNDNVYILLELCNNHTLNEMLKKRKRISEVEVQYFLKQIVEGLGYIHSNRVIHRDLKLGNLMLNENMELKIGDFGLAAKLDFTGEKRKTVCGTPNYIAPEILDGKGHTYEVDIWSLGAILYALLYGRPPFETSDVKKTYKRIKQCQYTFNDDINISHCAKNLISRMLVVEVEKRFSLEQVKDHPFVRESRAPKMLPTSILTSPLPKSFLDQYVKGNSGITNHYSSKNLERSDFQERPTKSSKGMSERLIMKPSSSTNATREIPRPTHTPSNNTRPNLLANNFLGNKMMTSQQSKRAKQIVLQYADAIFVKKWVDYSSKYGLGYLLSNGQTGIYFNDSSKMVLNGQKEEVNYLSSENQLQTYSMNDQNEARELTKKLTLMQYFRKYLNGYSTGSIYPNKSESSTKNAEEELPFVYVKQWVKSADGIMFRLNNSVLQVNFNDRAQVVIYTEKAVGVYSDCQRGGERIFFSLNSGELDRTGILSSRMQQIKIFLSRLQQKTPAKSQQEVFNEEAQPKF